MNTIRSTWLGWGVLCVAGGGAYYFAKRSINADRAARYEAEHKKQTRLRKVESYAASSEPFPNLQKTSSEAPRKKATGGSQSQKGLDHAGDPSSEAAEEMAPVGHAPETSEQRMRERSKYEAAEPFRSKKGDRFS